MKPIDQNPQIAQIAHIHARSTPGARLQLDPSWWGFGGLHGGLALSLLVAAMQASAQGRALQQVSGRFRRALRSAFTLQVPEPAHGKTVSWLDAHAIEQGQAALSASAVFAQAGPPCAQPIAPPMPDVPPPAQCPLFQVPEQFVPFARHTEIRPVGHARPYSGAAEPQLMAWLRITDDELPPDAARLVVLMDALAPSYGAMLHALQPLPTVTFSVTPGSGLAQAGSPWVLLHARTDVCHSQGWLLERLHAWAPGGAHLGSAEQLRVLLPAAPQAAPGAQTAVRSQGTAHPTATGVS
ncbi:thioesterase family protein [Vandammella animalimorsus]|uniref:thioesterase family protein n=1 Tax=Vandammella animalimorsus TaxID=2029117 RepID=UPI00325B4837